MEENTTEPDKKSKKKLSMKVSNKSKVVIILFIILLGVAVYFAWKYNESKKQVEKLSNPQTAIRQEADDLKAKVGQLVDLPDEQPTIASVTDISKLKGQVFFAKAANGDKVLIFTKAQRAVIYRPSTNKVIEYSPVNLGNNTSGTSKDNSSTNNNQ